ncbi:MAG: ribosome assembly factor SBDS [Candidatus Altiarchaeales archaeon]|nr:MAG: ribosome assembly factor SBDS [Candidatus Altiarchaeales archaeon]RLI94418.1 MAG: ribosome assembly factor SBDS [Candidatus Altiarchaeales archaeon]RLI94502.1 MAG: ribosome assembly factor SBDS [Candidatus Altiarchaeales archaeon]HDO82627.1 ribosome assembly factor SBDS [Candidatus Altiarchaeales archaeon]HEX55276.1 ribosome assembly factor SBDS [Candidatus Altiarchaeales archaeon]
MVSLDRAVIARLKIRGETFEILVDPDLALQYRQGRNVNFDELLAINSVFRDARSGERASEQLMKKFFGSYDVERVASEILKRGEIGLTTEQRRRMLEEKRKQIASIISKNAINPQTNTPHPPARIEKAMKEARVNIDIFKSAEEQVEAIIKKLQPIIPIRLETLEIAVKIPAQYSGICYKILYEFGNVKKEEWLEDSYFCLLEIPAGLRDEFYDKINKLTRGDVRIKVVK